MKYIILNVVLALILSACVPVPTEQTAPTVTSMPEHWTDATAGLHDFASVLAIADETDDLEPYLALVEEFADCMADDLDEEEEELSPSEMVAMTIWASGLFAAFSWFNFENGGEDTSYSYIQGAIEACRQSNEE